MIGAARIRRLAAESGYREEIVEKVLYLEAILRQLARHPDLETAWALKGGTCRCYAWRVASSMATPSGSPAG